MPTITRKHTGKVETGKRAVAPSIMRAAERGALPEDVRAARAGLITSITPHSGKKTATTARHQPTGEWKQLQKREQREKEMRLRVQRYERAVYHAVLRGDDPDSIEF